MPSKRKPASPTNAAVSLPSTASQFYVRHLSPLDYLILGLGAFLFLVQLLLALRALQS